jgi:hypothetical protein
MTPRLDEATQLLAAGDRDLLAFRILNRDPEALHADLVRRHPNGFGAV